MRRLLPCALVVALSLLGACGDALGPDSNEVGTYTLVSVNGRSLPTHFFLVEVVSATIVLKPDHRYETESAVRGKDSLGELVTQTHKDTGTYTRTDDTVQLTSTDGHVTAGTYGGRTITVNSDTVAMVYRR